MTREAAIEKIYDECGITYSMSEYFVNRMLDINEADVNLTIEIINEMNEE